MLCGAMRPLLAALLLAAACGPKITMVKTNPPPHALTPKPADAVEIFTTKLPGRPYAEVAVFSASKGKAEDHIDALRARAGEYGCDGLVFTVMPSQHTTTASSGQIGEPSTTTTATSVGSSSATCVAWIDAPPAPPEPQPASAPAP